MSRDDIKKIVYECASNRFYEQKTFDNNVSKHPNNGEDLLIYSEIGFDSLDMITFIMELENKNELLSELPDNLFDSTVTLGRIIDYIYNKKQKENG